MIKTKFVNPVNKIQEKQEYLKNSLSSQKFIDGSPLDKKNIIQKAVLQDWKDNDYNAAFLISMGVGKSKIISDAISNFITRHSGLKQEFDTPVLVLVNSSALRDTGLPQELKKWGCKSISNVRIECYQFAYKNKLLLSDNIGLLVCDEVDSAISSKIGKIFDKIKCKERLFLTGTISKEKRELIKTYQKFPPIVYEYDVQKAQADGVINKTKLYLHHVPLYTEKNLKFTGKFGDYYLSEQANYIYAEDRINAFRKLAYANKGKKEEKRYLALKKYWESSPKNLRNRVLQMTENRSLIDYANKLKELILSHNDENKVIFFATRTDIIDQMTNNGYYGKISDEIIEEFNVGNIRDIGVCKKANRGVSFTGLNHCIAQSYTSSETDQNQGIIGRMTRLDTDEVASIHLLVSTYKTTKLTEDYCHNYNWLKELLEVNMDELVLIEDINDTVQHLNEI